MRQRLHPFLHRLPPGPGRFPYLVVTEAFRAYDNPLGTFMRYVETYGPVFTLRFLGAEIVLLVGPEANQYILVEAADRFSWELGWMGDLIPFIGRGLLTTDGEEHDRARRLLLPVFRPDRIRAYAEHMVRRAEEAVRTLPSDRPFDLQRWVRELALTIAGDLLFGMRLDPRTARHFRHRFEAGLSFFAYPIHLQVLRGPGTPWWRMRRARGALERMLRREIARRRRRGVGEGNILDLLIGAEFEGERFSDTEIVDQALTLLFAGHDTTTATVAWLFSLVGQHRLVYERLASEIEARLAERPAGADDLLGGLPYLDQVVAETLRLYPPAWIGPRRALETFELYGHRIPAGTNVAYSSWLSHRLPHVFPDPDAFDPERFTPERLKALQPGAYVPFGRGRRLCIGMRFGELEVKAITATLLRHWHLELVPGQDFRPTTMPTISPRNGVYVRLRPRGTVRTKVRALRTPRRRTTATGCPVHAGEV